MLLFLIHPTRVSPLSKRHLDRFGFSRVSTAESPYTLQWALSPVNIRDSRGWIWTPSNTWFPGPTRINIPNGIFIGSAVFAGLTTVTDRQTDHAYTPSVGLTIGPRPHLRSTAMRPNNIFRNSVNWWWWLLLFDRVKEVVCFGEGAGANILTRFAVSTDSTITRPMR